MQATSHSLQVLANGALDGMFDRGSKMHGLPPFMNGTMFNSNCFVARSKHPLMKFGTSQVAMTCVFAILAVAPVRSQELDQSEANVRSEAQVQVAIRAGQTEVVPSLEILPADFTLDGPESFQRLIVHDISNGQRRGQQDEVEWTVDDPDVCDIRRGVVRPKSNGSTVIHASVAGRTTSTSVTVKRFDESYTLSFRHDVLPILSKVGCNSGACHGALAGKGGFRLSLRGYDPPQDHFTMTRQAKGRRIEPADPGRSLVLAKPSGGIPHQGGIRFDVDSREYRLIADWISTGAARPSDDDPMLESFQIFPDVMTVDIGETAELVARATYSDGRIVDVTQWVIWTSTDETVARVDESGRVEVIGSGDGAVTAWFSSQISIARVTSPYPAEIDEEVFTAAPVRNFIDELSLAQLERLKLPPSPRCEDFEFIRRAYLDCIGTLPTADQVKAFIADDRADKRDQLIDELLERPEFVDYWTHKWSDVLLINGTLLRPEAVKAYYSWIRRHVESNTPWDQFVREILTAQGDTLTNGATNFFALHQEPETMSENASQAFMGLSIACAKCHDHPLEKWTNDQYYSMASLFARVRGKGWGGDSRNGDGKRTVYVVTKGELIQPRTGQPQPPAPLDGEAIPFGATSDRRLHLASWLTSPENPYFSRSITNRVWANYFGVGLVDPVDDMRASNPASNEALLSAAADFLVENDFNLKALMREIMRSETYQRSSLTLEQNATETRFYSHYYPKRLQAEVLLDAISQVTDAPSEFTKIEFLGADTQDTSFYPKGTKAIQLYDSAVQSYFLKAFGRNQREITCECERSNEPSMIQVLHLANGTTLNEKLRVVGNRIDQLVDEGLGNEAIIEELYLATLCRNPTDREVKRLLAAMQVDGVERRELLEDVFWSVMSSREFLFNH